MISRLGRAATAGLMLLALGATSACGTAPEGTAEAGDTAAPATPASSVPPSVPAATASPEAPEASSAPPSPVPSAPAAGGVAAEAPGDPTRTPEALAAAFTADLPELATRSGVAITAIGSSGAALLGQVREDVAWSTIKVPLVVAVRRKDGWAAASDRARSAITMSDNDAAQSLWSALGEGAQSARAVESVLADSGDSATRVSATATRPPFTPFGQTRWSIENQARFLAGFSCRPESGETLDLMRSVVAEQRWGLGRWQGAAIKGGWGPLESGGYLVRQMGVVSTPSGQASVAIIVRAPGGFDPGAGDVTRIATWLQQHSGELPAGQCPAAAK